MLWRNIRFHKIFVVIRGSVSFNNYNNVFTDVPGEQESRDVSNAYQVPLAY